MADNTQPQNSKWPITQSPARFHRAAQTQASMRYECPHQLLSECCNSCLRLSKLRIKSLDGLAHFVPALCLRRKLLVEVRNLVAQGSAGLRLWLRRAVTAAERAATAQRQRLLILRLPCTRSSDADINSSTKWALRHNMWNQRAAMGTTALLGRKTPIGCAISDTCARKSTPHSADVSRYAETAVRGDHTLTTAFTSARLPYFANISAGGMKRSSRGFCT